MNRFLMRMLLLAASFLMAPTCGDEGDTIITTAGGFSPASGTLAVLTDNNSLFFVDPSNPGVVLKGLVISPLNQASTLFSSIDFRPATRELFAMETGTGNNRLYTIDVRDGFALRIGVNALTPSVDRGFDFNPVTDRLRIVDPTELNFRVDVDLFASFTDTSLSPAGDVVALAHTNNTAGATVTTLFGIDSVAATLVRIGGVDGSPLPNGGVVTTIGPLGVTPAVNDVSFDIGPSGIAYASIPTPGGLWRLYTINLTTGAATEVGILGNGGRVLGISVVP